MFKEHSFMKLDFNEYQNILDLKSTKNGQKFFTNFGTFVLREKKSRIGRNPKTKVENIVKERKVVLFKPSKDFKKFVNINNESK